MNFALSDQVPNIMKIYLMCRAEENEEQFLIILVAKMSDLQVLSLRLS